MNTNFRLILVLVNKFFDFSNTDTDNTDVLNVSLRVYSCSCSTWKNVNIIK